MPTAGFQWQIIMSAYARYVFNDITLDGNTFKSSQSIPLEHGQWLATIGFAISWKSLGLAYSYQRGSDEFEGQISASKFGAVSLTYTF